MTNKLSKKDRILTLQKIPKRLIKIPLYVQIKVVRVVALKILF